MAELPAACLSWVMWAVTAAMSLPDRKTAWTLTVSPRAAAMCSFSLALIPGRSERITLVNGELGQNSVSAAIAWVINKNSRNDSVRNLMQPLRLFILSLLTGNPLKLQR